MTQPAQVAEPAAEAVMAPVEPVSTPDPSAPISLDIAKAFESEDYLWPTEESEAPKAPASPAEPQSPVTPAEPVAETAPVEPAAPTEPDAEQEAVVRALLRGETLSKEQKAVLAKNPTLRDIVEERAQHRFGNLKQQDDARRQQEDEREQQWATSTSYYEDLQRIKTADPKEYAKLTDPDTEKGAERVRWIADYQRAARARAEERTPSSAPVDLEAAQQEWASQVIPRFNEEAAATFAQQVKTLPFYANLPVKLRENLENGRQTDESKTWLEEYVGELGAGIMAWHKQGLAEREEAIRNEMRAQAAGESGPVVIRGNVEGPFDPRAVLSAHANGANVPEADLRRANRELGYED